MSLPTEWALATRVVGELALSDFADDRSAHQADRLAAPWLFSFRHVGRNLQLKLRRVAEAGARASLDGQRHSGRTLAGRVVTESSHPDIRSLSRQHVLESAPLVQHHADADW